MRFTDFTLSAKRIIAACPKYMSKTAYKNVFSLLASHVTLKEEINVNTSFHNEITHYICQNVYYKKNNKNKCLPGCGEKKNSQELLVVL